MLNKEKHQLIMGEILKEIYTDIEIGTLLGFKGGTCAYFFYNLPRFSVDLDFDLLEIDTKKQKLVFKKIVAILNKYGQVKNQYIKRFTIFALLSYGDEDHNIKIEINIRKISKNIKEQYELKEYLGILMLVAKKEYLFAGKISALTLRKEVAIRDIFDIYYFTKNHWNVNTEIVKNLTNMNIKDQLTNCIALIEKIKDNQMLQGLGELIEDKKEKSWVKNHLKSETIFMLKNYISILR